MGQSDEVTSYGDNEEKEEKPKTEPAAPARTPRYIKPPEYGRTKVDVVIEAVGIAAEQMESAPEFSTVTLTLTRENLLILNDMLYEMDRHLPDFFEDDRPKEEEDGES
jgi:hypothetical protein